jgi:hypothetical protein
MVMVMGLGWASIEAGCQQRRKACSSSKGSQLDKQHKVLGK